MIEYIQQFLGKEKPKFSKQTRETIRRGYSESNKILQKLCGMLTEEQFGNLKKYRKCEREYMQSETQDMRTAAFALGILLGAEAIYGGEKSVFSSFFMESPFAEREFTMSEASRRCEMNMNALDLMLQRDCPKETVQTYNDMWTAEADTWFSCRDEVMADALRKGIRLGFSSAELWQKHIR